MFWLGNKKIIYFCTHSCARVKSLSYLHNVFAKSKDLDEPSHVCWLINASAIPSQDLHRLEKYLNTEGFLEKPLKIKYALKSTGKITQMP